MCIKHRHITLILMLGMAIGNLHGQKPETLNCLIIQDGLGKPVTYAHIYNESRRFGSISDSLGHFKMKVLPGDTLIFIALGYLGKYYVVGQDDFKTTQIISLVPRSYEIEELSFHFPRSYTHFKHEILTLDPDENKPLSDLPEYNPYKTPYLFDTTRIYSAGFILMHPVSGLYYRFSKVEKSKRKVWQLQQQEMKQARVDEKYNRKLVFEITGLSDELLTHFIGFCNFSFSYLFESTPYEIVEAIELKYQKYLECCYDKENDYPNH